MQNSIYKIKYLGLGGVVFDCLGGNTPHPLKETLLEIRGENVFTA